eukprot:417765-Alexandrium_andersonii.AAC.1
MPSRGGSAPRTLPEKHLRRARRPAMPSPSDSTRKWRRTHRTRPCEVESGSLFGGRAVQASNAWRKFPCSELSCPNWHLRRVQEAPVG